MSRTECREDDMDDTKGESTGSNGHDAATNAAPGGGAADETFGWTTPDQETTAGGGDARATAERAIAQLQSMIDSLATQAAPVVRQIGAKAAELAAVAADRAGPLVHKAADATADASGRLAERSRTWAADLRNKAGTTDDPDAASSASAAIDGADDAIEEAAKDDPAEGRPA
jgi:ElaB/YqjD/DUF883 family membrane-anchored ribosome-binding protein